MFFTHILIEILISKIKLKQYNIYTLGENYLKI
jgi:hypothetical protein